VGLIQRIIEEGGIPTISVSLSREITEKVKPPRAIFPGFNLGHPLGAAERPFVQKQILRLALKSLIEIQEPGTILNVIMDNKANEGVSCSLCSR